MPKIQRKTQKIFCNSADSDQLAVFGSMSTGTPVYSSDIEELQSNEAFDLGWDAATLEDKAPFMEEMNGVQYGLTYQIAYGLQEGIPEYDAATTYYIGSICKVLEDGKPVLYTSLTDNNIGNDPVNDSTNWERLSFGGGGLEIGDVGFTQMAIDETKGKRRVLNGQLIIQDQYVQFTNIIKESVALNPSLACTEEEWQTAVTMSTNGVCEKFVIDDNAGTIRLPKYPTYLDLTNNTSNVPSKTATVSVKGTGVALGLTNGSTNYGLGATANQVVTANTGNYNRALGQSYQSTTGASTTILGVTADASKSGLTGSVTIPAIAGVKSEKITGQYFIQVATGAEIEDNIINEIELNNPFSLLDYKYSEYELNNLSWLRSNGQYNSKAVYPAVYELLLKIYNGTETKAGVSVKLSTEAYTDEDFVINQDDETFRLQLKVKLASGKAVVGNGMTLGLTGINHQYGLYSSSTTSTGLIGQSSAYGTNVGTTVSDGSIAQSSSLGVTTDPTKSGLELSDNDLYLYFYVGETVQNANLINAGRIEEKVASLIPNNSSMISGYGMPSNKYVDFTLGASGTTYTAPANGYYLVTKASTAAGQYVQIWLDNGTALSSIVRATATDQSVNAYLPVKRGDKVIIYYTAGGTTNRSRFIYAQGEV